MEVRTRVGLPIFWLCENGVAGLAEPLQVASLFSHFTAPWLIAGGWAIDLYLGRVTRPHKDIEIAILRRDQRELRAYLAGWEFAKVVPKLRVEPWVEGEWLALPVHELHARRPAGDPSELEILLNEASGEEWRFRRNLVITRPLERIGMRAAGIPFLCPEVVLLYKAQNPQPHDQADWRNVQGVLEPERHEWLRQALAICYPDHPWLAEMGRPQ
jgi:hypothetical protein